MQNMDQQTVNLSKPEELAYWAKLLKVKPLHIIRAAKITGSNLVNRMIFFLKAEGVIPSYFDVSKAFGR